MHCVRLYRGGGGRVHLKAYMCVQGGSLKSGVLVRTYFMDAPKQLFITRGFFNHFSYFFTVVSKELDLGNIVRKLPHHYGKSLDDVTLAIRQDVLYFEYHPCYF